MSNFAPIIPPKHAEHWVYEAFRSISAQIGQHALDLAAVGRGEAPDGSGNALIDTTGFFFLPGRNAGQIGYGGTGPNQDLTLSSTRDADKGFIYLGLSAPRFAYDEDQAFLGVGTDNPTARFHSHLLTPGTTGLGTLGTHFAEYSVTVSGSTKNILALAAYANNGSSWDVAFVSGGSNPINGIGSIFFTDYNTGSSAMGVRFAYGTYGSNNIKYMHFQAGSLFSDGTTQNRNALFCGFNDHCGSQYTFHTVRLDIQCEGDNLSGTVRSGFTTNTNIACIGINSPSENRTGTAQYDQPVVVISDGSWYATRHDMALRLDQTNAIQSTDNAIAKTEIFGINGGSGRTFALDGFGRVCLYNPGNGALTSRLSGRRSTFLIEDGVTGASTPSCNFELVSLNAWLDGGTAIAAMNMRVGYDDVQTSQPVRNVIVGGTVRVASSEASLLNRYAVRTSAFYITDGTFTYNSGQVGAPLGMLNVFNFVTNATILVALKRKSGQTGEFFVNYSSDGTTKLSGFDVDGAYFLAAGASLGYIYTSSSAGVGSWASPASVMAAPHAYVAKSSDYTAAATDEIIYVDCTSGPVTITLPTAVGVAGKVYTIKKVDSTTNILTVATTSSQTIDGSTTQTTDMQYTAISMNSDGANWGII